MFLSRARSYLKAASTSIAACIFSTLIFLPLAVVAETADGSANVRVLTAPQAVSKTPVVTRTQVANAKAAVSSPNPWVSFLPVETRPDYEGWRQRMNAEAEKRALARQQAAQMSGVAQFQINQNESEPSNTKGLNDTIGTAEPVTGFGTGPGDDPSAIISGNLRVAPAPGALTQDPEDEGSIPLATDSLLADESSLVMTGTIGDGPFGSAQTNFYTTDVDSEDDGSITLANATGMVPFDSIIESAAIGDGPQGSTGTATGDFDFFEFSVTGRVLAFITVSATDGAFRPTLSVYRSDGFLFQVIDDLSEPGSVFLFAEFTDGGSPSSFYLGVGGNINLDGDASDEILTDPFNANSGVGIGSEGTYDISIEFVPPGDFDYVEFSANAGDFFTLEVDTDPYFGILDPILSVRDSGGTLLDFNDDGTGQGSEPFDSFLSFTAPATGTYYAEIGGFSVFPTSADSFLGDASDSSSGPGWGAEGDYDFTITRNITDIDVFSFDLAPGDVIGTNITGAAPFVFLLDSLGGPLIGSGGDASGIYPPASLLPGGGNASSSYVVNDAGTYYALVFGGEGAYDLELAGFRPPQEASRTEQTIFLDFDGATLDTTIFGGGLPNATLSPLSAFLTDWGLQASDEDALIDAIIAEVERSLENDIKAQGSSSIFSVNIINSRDHADPFPGGGGSGGGPNRMAPGYDVSNTSRIIVGGTIAESGISTIGIAQSIDVGNFEMSETALVLLDLLSDPSPSNPNSLNQYGLGGGATKIDLVAAGVGNITAHEAGHFLANFHTNNASPTANIMDTGGNLDGLVGVGPDRIYGTGDDDVVTFGVDDFDPFEGFIGMEDTRNSIGWALPGGAAGISCSSGAPPVICALGDINADGSPDVAVATAGASLLVEVRDGVSGADLGTLDFGTDPAVAVEVIPDLNGNGAPEIAVLANRPNGQVRVLVYDSLDGSVINSVFYGSTYVALDMAVVPDSTGNGAAELAVLGRSLAGGIRVQARDALDDSETSTTFYGSNADPVDVQVLPDMNGNGFAEILMHATVTASGQARAQIRDSETGVMVQQLFFGSVYESIQMAIIRDVTGDGLPDVAHLGRRSDTGAGRVMTRASTGGPVLSNAFIGTELPIEVIDVGDVTGDGWPDVGVLVERANGTGKVIIRDGVNGDFVRNTFVGKVAAPEGLVLTDDANDSGDPDFAALGDSTDNPGTPRVQVRDAEDGAAVTDFEIL